MMGLEIKTPFQTFTDTGFPKELIEALEKETGHRVIGNKAASGTEILDELAEEEIKTGAMIVYTSSDSVLQICGNEETFGLDELYRCCKIARELTMKPEWKVGRVIARPYVGKKKGEFKRTANRHDYALKPYGKTAMDALKEAGFDVISIGKIRDIFDGEGITQAIRSKSSVQGMEQTIECLDQDFTGLCFTNLVDFDALWGHRRNPQGYAEELEKFDVLFRTVFREDEGRYPRTEQTAYLDPEYLDLAEARIAAVREAVGSKVDIILENHCYTDAQSAVQFGNMAKKIWHSLL